MEIARATIALLDVEPRVRRVVDLPIAITLADLHAVIQAAMGWTNSHMHEFRVGKNIYGTPFPGLDDSARRILPAAKIPLRDLLTSAKLRLHYIYDFGDDWQHRIDIKRLADAADGEAYPRLIEAEGRCPPEDVGGFPGYDHFLEALNDPQHPDHADIRDWHGGNFDPTDPDQPTLAKNVAKIAARLARKKAAKPPGRPPRG